MASHRYFPNVWRNRIDRVAEHVRHDKPTDFRYFAHVMTTGRNRSKKRARIQIKRSPPPRHFFEVFRNTHVWILKHVFDGILLKVWNVHQYCSI